MDEDKFVKTWLVYLVGLGMCGYASDQNDGPIAKAFKAIELPKNCEEMARKMYRSATANKGDK